VVGFTLLEVINILVIYVLVEVTGIDLLATLALTLVVGLALLELFVILVVFFIVLLNVASIVLLAALALACKTSVSVSKACCENMMHTLMVRLASDDIGSVQVGPMSIIVLFISLNIASTVLLSALALALVMASLDLHHGVTSILLATLALALVVRLTSLNHSSTANESSNEVGGAS
jgi:hypothetical protein